MNKNVTWQEKLPKKMTQITENDVMLNDKQNNVPLPKKITQITENDVTLKNKKKWRSFA